MKIESLEGGRDDGEGENKICREYKLHHWQLRISSCESPHTPTLTREKTRFYNLLHGLY